MTLISEKYREKLRELFKLSLLNELSELVLEKGRPSQDTIFFFKHF